MLFLYPNFKSKGEKTMENTEKKIEKRFNEMKEYTRRRIEEFGEEAVLLEEEALQYATITEDFYDLVYELIYVNEAIDDPSVTEALISMNPYLDRCCENSGIIDEKLHKIESAWWESDTPPASITKCEYLGIDLDKLEEDADKGIIY